MMKKKMLSMLVLGAGLLTATAWAQKDAKPEGEKIAWQKWATVITSPALQNAAFLSDGDLKTAPRLTRGGEAGVEITIKFPQPLDVTLFRFVQVHSEAKHYKIFADMESKGDFSTLIADRNDADYIKNEWIEIPVNKKVTGLKFVAVAGKIGYRASFPAISEIEIYSKEKIKPRGFATYGGTRVQNGAFKNIPELDKRDIDIRICTDIWNYNLNGWEKTKEKSADGKRVPMGEWNGYRNLIMSLKELDVNSVRLFDETLCGPNGKFPFPTKLDPEHCYDWLKPLTDELKKDGYTLYYFTHAWKPPFQKRGEMAPSPWLRWDYPYHQSDTLIGINENYKVAYPCVICNDEYRLKWTQMMRDALANGATGIYIMPDEYFFKGHNLSRANCADCTREFKKLFGYDSMPKLKAPTAGTNEGGQVTALLPDDTEQYRKWKLFEYIKLSELFKKVSADLKKDYPKAILVNSDNQGTIEAGRLEHTVASDIIGTDPNADFAQVYGGGGSAVDAQCANLAFIKRFEASAGKNKLLSSAGWGPARIDAPATSVYNGIIPHVMVGASAVEVYRHNYMYMNNGVSVYKKTFRMIRLLEKWGIQNTEIPDSVCMLLGRAGEDWYYTKVAAMMSPEKKSAVVDFYLHLADESINKIIASESNDDMERFLAHDKLRGMGARLTMESILTSNGIPYKVAYTERPDNMKNLNRFKTVVVPFAYSLSKDAFAELKTAAEAGTKLIIFEQLAPTNEYGTKYEKPLLEELIENKNVTFIKDSLFDYSADLGKLADYKKLIMDSLGKDNGYVFENNGNQVVYIVTALPDDSGYILYLCNAAPRINGSGRITNPANVMIGLPAKGEYKMETYSSDTNELNENLINGNTVFTEKDLKRFVVSVDPQEVKLVRIYK